MAGGLCLAAFAALDSLSDGARISFVHPWDRVAPGEAIVWLGAWLLLLPGAALVGYAWHPLATWVWRTAATHLEGSTARQRARASVLLVLLLTILAQLANATIFHGLPFTDDEYGARFGGQLWASGAFSTAVPEWLPAAPQLFLFARDGRVASFDFPGVMAAWALAEATASGTWVFSFLAGLGACGIVVAVGRRHGARFSLLALAVLLASPHFTLLSATSHAHLISRSLVGVAFGLLLFVDGPSSRRLLLGGLLLGLGAFARPIEVTAVAGPLALGLLADAVRARRYRDAVSFLAAGLVPIGLLLMINWATARSLLPARLLSSDIVHPYADVFRPVFDFASWPARFGNNVAYNFMMSGIFLLGPLGLPLAFLGRQLDVAHRRLAMGVALAFATALLHDDRGVHAVGPIHYSEASVSLLLLAVTGLRGAVAWLEKHGAPPGLVRGSLAGYLAVGLTIFTAGYAVAHWRSTSAQRDIYANLEDQAAPPRVVLAPPYARVFQARDASRVGTWVFAWRRVTPQAEEPTVILHDSHEARAGVVRWFPDREVWVLSLDGPGSSLVPLSQAGPAPASSKRRWVPLVRSGPVP